jgi:hypothetical protein
VRFDALRGRSGDARDELWERGGDREALDAGQVDDGAVWSQTLANVANAYVQTDALTVVFEGNGVDGIGKHGHRVLQERAVPIEVADARLLVELERAPERAHDFEAHGRTAISDPTHPSAPAPP